MNALSLTPLQRDVGWMLEEFVRRGKEICHDVSIKTPSGNVVATIESRTGWLVDVEGTTLDVTDLDPEDLNALWEQGGPLIAQLRQPQAIS